MKESRKILKLKARRALLGKYPAAVGIYIVTGMMEMFLMTLICVGIILSLGFLLPTQNEEMELLSILGLFFLGMMVLIWFMCLVIPGYLRFYLNICQGGQARFTDMFWGFGSCGGKFWGIGLMLTLLFGLLMMPEAVLFCALAITKEVLFPVVFLMGYNVCLTIVGIYAALTYGQFYLILADNPDMTMYQALAESRRLMRGNRWRHFVLGLSFLGWFLIAYITFGWAMLWLVPYIMSTNVYFYLNLKEFCRE